MNIRFYTPEQVAEEMQLPLATFLSLKKRHHWVGVKFGRFNLRFTEEQVKEIVRQHTESKNNAGQGSVGPLPGQTARSAARSA